MIREIQISARDADDQEYYEPPTQVLNLSVIGEDAYLQLYSMNASDQPGTEPLCSFEVPARSLLIALQAALDDGAAAPRKAAGSNRDQAIK